MPRSRKSEATRQDVSAAADALPVPDVNVLVALTNPSHQYHAEAHRWLAGVTQFATTPVTEIGLVRLLLNPAITGQEISIDQAIGVLAGIRADARAVFIPDDSSLADARIDLIGLAGHRQATDFHLVNLAARHGGVLVTLDQRITASLTEADRSFMRMI